MRLAAIDVGTNTTLLLVAEAAGDQVTALAERAEITRLGRGIGGDGRLRRENIDRTLAVLGGYGDLARRLGAPIVAVGTEALRRAPNAAEFLQPAADLLGVAVEVIDGEREAALAFSAAARSFPREAQGALAVIDIGGGSTEVILAEGGVVRFRASLPLGSVRLTERHLRHDPPREEEVAKIFAEVEARLASVPFGGRDVVLVGTAGTVTTVAAMAQGLEDYDSQRVHGFRLTRTALEREIERLRRSTQAERETMAGLDPRRADVILAGACILLGITRRADAAHVVVSDRGVRWGLVYERFASPPR